MRTNPVETSRSITATARREQITNAAIEVLAADGFAATSLSAIADRIGVSKGVLSYHFSSKSELLGEVVRSVLAQAEKWMTPRLVGAASYRAALHSYISANLSYLDAHRTAIRALTEVLANSRAVPGLAEFFAASQHKAVDDLATLVAGGQAAHEFGDVPARLLATSLRATIDSTSEAMRSDPDFDLAEFEHGVLLLYDRATARSKPGDAEESGT